MSAFEVCLDDIEQINRKQGATWGIICVKCNDLYFPDEAWSDAASSILEMWMSMLNDFFRNGENRCTLPFMDGDYEIELIKRDAGNIDILCKSRDMVLAEHNTCALELINSIQMAVLKLLNHYRKYSLSFKKRREYYRLMKYCKKMKKIKEKMGESFPS